MTFIPSVIRAEFRGGYRVHILFNDNSEKTVDFSHWLKGPVFEPLRDPKYFRRFFLDGGTIAWPNGADVAPETLYDYEIPRKRLSRRLAETSPTGDHGQNVTGGHSRARGEASQRPRK